MLSCAQRFRALGTLYLDHFMIVREHTLIFKLISSFLIDKKLDQQLLYEIIKLHIEHILLRSCIWLIPG